MPESRVAEVSKGDATEATAPEPAPAPATPLQQKGFGAAGVPHADHKRDDHECVSCLSFYMLQDFLDKERNVTKVTWLSLMERRM